MTSTNIAVRFMDYAAAHPGQTALVQTNVGQPSRHYSYRQLNEDCDIIARGLRRAGIDKGDRVVLMVPPGAEFFSVAYALFRLGAVLVGVDPGMGIRTLGRCLAEAAPAAFIGNRKAHLARGLLRWARATLRLRITTEPIPWPGGILSLDRIRAGGRTAVDTCMAETQAHDMAAILFTSGSTGAPRGAIYTHANFAAQVTALQQTFDIRPGEIDLATFPLFALYAPVMGMTSVIPTMDFTRPADVDPAQIHHAITACQATSMFGSPALLRRLGLWGQSQTVKFSSLRRVLSAGAPVAPAVLEHCRHLLSPGVQIHTPYGATEALPVSSIGSDEVLMETRSLTDAGRGVCVGRAVAGIDLRIIPITDEPITRWSDDLVLPLHTVGEIAVRGPQVTAAYYQRETATQLAKIATDDGGCYHRMGDLGYLDESGRLWFCGRKSQRVITARGVLYTIPCEGVFNTHPQVARTALVGAGRPAAAQPVLCVEPEPAVRKSEYPRIESELLALGARHEHTMAIRSILFHPGFPVDIRHNAKINREALARWAHRRLG